MKKYLSYLLLITFPLIMMAKKLKVKLIGKDYDSLYIYDRRMVQDRYKLNGIKISSDMWLFDIPDSICISLPEFELTPCPFDYKTKSTSFIRIGTVSAERDSCYTQLINIENDNDFIIAQYNNSDTIQNTDPCITQMPDKSYKTIKRSKFIIDNFILKKTSIQDIYVRFKDPFYGSFFDFKGEKNTYNDFMTYYISLAKKYPQSKYLLLSLCKNLSAFHSYQDVKQIYELLSSQYKQMAWGKNISDYMGSEHFRNIQLYSLLGRKTYIIQDSTKFNLLVFSASWCRPCHELIPILKNIYHKYKNVLHLTYICLDSPKTIINWHKLIKNEKIPWRSVFAKEKYKDMQQLYYLHGIPTVFLVTPSMQKINIYLPQDMKKLEQLIYEVSQ